MRLASRSRSSNARANNRDSNNYGLDTASFTEAEISLILLPMIGRVQCGSLSKTSRPMHSMRLRAEPLNMGQTYPVKESYRLPVSAGLT